jgi:2'-5' RNA ligase
VCYNERGIEMEQIRSFVAIELEDELKTELKRIQESLRGKGIADDVRWVRPEGVHLTLKFLGNVPANRIHEIVPAMADSTEGVEPFSINLAGLACFPSLARPNVIWVGVGGETSALARIQANIETNLTILGYPPEKREYTPHLTLGRVDRRIGATDRRRFGALIQTETVASHSEMLVREISLMKSELSPAGARYTRLGAVQLEEHA